MNWSEQVRVVHVTYKEYILVCLRQYVFCFETVKLIPRHRGTPLPFGARQVERNRQLRGTAMRAAPAEGSRGDNC